MDYSFQSVIVHWNIPFEVYKPQFEVYNLPSTCIPFEVYNNLHFEVYNLHFWSVKSTLWSVEIKR